MDIEPVKADLSSPLVLAQVKVFQGQKEQLKALMSTLLESIAASAPRAPEQSGHRLNVVA